MTLTISIYWPHSVCVIPTWIPLTLIPWRRGYVDDIFPLAAFFMRCSYPSPQFFQSTTLISLTILLGLLFGMNTGRTPCAFYSLRSWIPTMGGRSPVSIILPADDYIRAPQSSRWMEQPRRGAVKPIGGAGAVDCLGCGAMRGNKNRVAYIRLYYVVLCSPAFRQLPYTHLTLTMPCLLT